MNQLSLAEHNFLYDTLLEKIEKPQGATSVEIRSSILNWFNVTEFSDEEIFALETKLNEKFPKPSTAESQSN